MSSSSRDPRCDHCGLGIVPQRQVSADIGGVLHRFCCHGCHGAFLIIHNAGLDDFYQKRKWDTSGVPEGAFDSRYDDDFLATLVRHTDQGGAIDLFIDGIRCATCVWLIEKIVSRIDGVKSVRTNFATHVSRILFDENITSPGAIIRGISALGYLPAPVSTSGAQQLLEKEFTAMLVRFGTAAFFSMPL